MIRKINANDKQNFIKMARKFYCSNAVMHNIPKENSENTFNEIINGSPYAESFIAEKGGKVVGYVLLALTYSNEAGGMAVWIEELYVLPEYQNQGIGSELLTYIIEKYKDKTARFRLEIEENNIGAKKLYQRFGFKDLDYKQMYI